MTDEPKKPDAIALTETEKARRRQDRLVRSLATYAGKTRRLLHRVSQLRLFGEDRSHVEWADHPLVQIVLRHRDSYERLNGMLEVARNKVEKFDDQEVVMEGLKTIRAIERERESLMNAMERPLTTLQADLSKASATMAKMLADAQKLGLAYQALDQKERLSSKGKSVPTDDEVDAFLE